MKLELLALAFLAIAFTSCKKSSEDPIPFVQGSGHYRISKVNANGIDLKDVSVYTYYADGKLKQMVTMDSNSTQTYKSTYQYNANGFVIFTSQQNITYQGSSAYTYTANNLVSTRINYSDLTGTSATTTTVYHYYPNKDLQYSIATQTVGMSTYIDSTVYTNYTNGRPGIKRKFNKYSNAYQLQYKYLFTYDARMNLIKRESTTSDSTVFIVSSTAAFNVMDTEVNSVWNDLAVIANGYIYGDNNISPGNKDVDKDFKSEQTSSYSDCGISSKYTNTILQENASGYPVKIQGVYGNYNCGVLQNSVATTTTVTYEAY